jgi:hypothetical protein
VGVCISIVLMISDKGGALRGSISDVPVHRAVLPQGLHACLARARVLARVPYLDK